MMIKFYRFLFVVVLAWSSGCAALSAQSASPSRHELVIKALRESDHVLAPQTKELPQLSMYNREAVIPSQCYTKHEGTYNTCYVCHQAEIPERENVMNDDDLQSDYSFSELGLRNHNQNLFIDRRSRVAAMPTEEICDYIRQDNYSELPKRLKEVNFTGWIPDLAHLSNGKDAFDSQGFAKDGSRWVAFNYKPFPGVFFPTNGATDDVMIRLVKDFCINEKGEYSHDVYKANLAILEASMKGMAEIDCLPIDENAVQKDLNQDGKLSETQWVTDVKSFVGAAKSKLLQSFIYPEGTEFLHTVRYVDFDEHGELRTSPRMKEVRYMKKWKSYRKSVYANQYREEGFEKDAGNLPSYRNLYEHGLDNGVGWSVSGFIEGRNGRLRTLTYEENFSCMGCHGSIGSTIDKTFSFPRKVDGAKGWGYIKLRGMPDAPTKGESVGEIVSYLQRAGGGSELRHNEEMQARWFTDKGIVDPQKISKARDVHDLIVPSQERAMMLNKAYKCIVEEQSYLYGKDPTLVPAQNIYQKIDNQNTPTLPSDKLFRWNILMDWGAKSQATH